MKRIFLLFALLAAILTGYCIVSADGEHKLTLSVNGTSDDSIEIEKMDEAIVLVRAPEATAVRIFTPNHCDSNDQQALDDNNCWEYYDRYNPLNYLEHNVRFNSLAAGREILAQARYDDYPDRLDFRSETWAEGSSPWQVQSISIRLSLTAEGQVNTPSVDMPATVSVGEWLTATLGDVVEQVFYNADLFRLDGDQEIWLGGFECNRAHLLAIPMIGYDPGNYRLRFIGSDAGCDESEPENKDFTLTDGNIPDSLMVNKNLVPLKESVYFGIYVENAETVALEVTKEENPNWYAYREFSSRGGNVIIVREAFKFDESGKYQMNLKDTASGEVLSSKNITVESDRALDKPDLSDLSLPIDIGDFLTGEIILEDFTGSIDIEIQRVNPGGNWPVVYHSHRGTRLEGWNHLDLPPYVLPDPGIYKIQVIARSNDNYDLSGAEMFFVVRNAGDTPVTLSVNASDADIESWPSSKDFTVEATAEGATAIRILREGGWWDVRDTPDGYAKWKYGLGDGDYELIAQMTTAEPVWRAEGFNWGSFDWNGLTWTDYSNLVMLHVESQGELEVPEVTLSPADGQVARGNPLTVTVAEQNHAQWIWADLRTLAANNPYDRHLETLEKGHFDSDRGRMSIMIPTFQLEPGDYWLVVGVDAEDWSGRETYIPLTINEAVQPMEYALALSRDEIQAGEGIKIYAWARGAENMNLEISWDRDPEWRDYRGTGAEFEIWDCGFGSGGIYTFSLTIHYSDKDDVVIEETLEVTSKRKLKDPVLKGIPSVIGTDNNGINGSFDAIEGADRYDVELVYIPEEGDWEQLYWERLDLGYDETIYIHFSSDYFRREGMYQLSVNAGALGFDTGYDDRRILVTDLSNPAEGLILSVNGKTSMAEIGDILLNNEVTVSLEKPANVTAARVWDGRDWDIWAGADDNFMRSWYPEQDGTMTYIAQATTDQSVAQWREDHDNDFSGFDWSQVDWSLTSNDVSFNVICFGKLDAPELYLDTVTVERGSELTLAFDPVNNAERYGVILQTPDGEWIYDAEYSEPGTYTLLTDTIPAGSYKVVVEPRRIGWRTYRSSAFVTVTEIEWTETQVFKIAKTEVLSNEDFAAVICAPGAQEVLICVEDPEDTWVHTMGDNLLESLRCHAAGEFRFRGYAKYQEDGEWVQIGEEIPVTVTAQEGSHNIYFTGAPYGNTGDDYTFSVTIEKINGLPIDYLNIDLYDIEDETFEDLLDVLHDQDRLEVTETVDDYSLAVSFTIPAGALPSGSYRVYANAGTDVMGFDMAEMEEFFDIFWDIHIRMDGVWTEGQALKFYVDPQGSEIHAEIRDRETQEIINSCGLINNNNWSCTFPAANFTPGQFYDLELSAGNNNARFALCMMPPSPDTLKLPAGLEEIQPGAFEGIAAQKIVIPGSMGFAGQNAFAGCPNLMLVELQGDPGMIAFDSEAFTGSEPFMVYGRENPQEFGYLIKEATFIYLNN